MTRIDVTIDRLVLNGLEAGNRQALVDALQGELSRVLSDPTSRAGWARSQRTPVVRLGPLPLDPGPAGSRKLGQGMARAIGKGLQT
jgi:hypothetical protein